MDWEFGVGKCQPVHLEWIRNKVLLYSTENYIWSLGQTMMENSICKKEYVYVHVSMCVSVCMYFRIAEIGATLKNFLKEGAPVVAG